MGSYIVNFTVYAMAMSGLIFFAVYIYKKVMTGGFRSHNSEKFLAVEETMSINPRKSLLVVRAGNEKFLVASDMDRTSLISKLESAKPERQPAPEFQNFMKEDIQQNYASRKIPKNRLIDIDIVQPEKEPVKLEPIKEKNPQAAQLRRAMDRREVQKPKEQITNKVILDFDKPKTHGLTTMREMAKKINEL